MHSCIMCVIIITIHNINRRYLFISRYFKLMLSHLSGLSCKHCAFILWQLHIVLIEHTELLTEQCQLKSMGTQPMRQKSNNKHFYVSKFLMSSSEVSGLLWNWIKKLLLIKNQQKCNITVKKINLGLQYNVAAINSLQFSTGANEWYLQSSLG